MSSFTEKSNDGNNIFQKGVRVGNMFQKHNGTSLKALANISANVGEKVVRNVLERAPKQKRVLNQRFS